MKRAPNYTWSPSYGVQDEAQSAWLARWYRLTTPKITEEPTTIGQRENIRRARLTSLVLLLTMILTFFIFFFTLLSWQSPNGIFFFLTAWTFCPLALYFNRQNKMTQAGLLVVISITASLYLDQLLMGRVPGWGALPDFDFLIVSLLLAATLLSSRSIFYVGGVNILFILLLFILHPPSSEIGAYMQMLPDQGRFQSMLLGIVIRPICLQIIVGVVSWIWLRSHAQALFSANHASVVAQLEHAMATQMHASATQANVLADEIPQLVQSVQQAKKGENNGRMQISTHHWLMPLVEEVNQLLTERQRLLRDEEELQRTRRAAAQLLTVMHQRTPLSRRSFQQTGTVIDALVTNFYLAQEEARKD